MDYGLLKIYVQEILPGWAQKILICLSFISITHTSLILNMSKHSSRRKFIENVNISVAARSKIPSALLAMTAKKEFRKS